MNENQRKTLIGAGAAVVVMLLFPPVAIRGVSFGYGFLFSRNGLASVNTSLLLTQWIAVGIVASIAWLLFRDR